MSEKTREDELWTSSLFSGSASRFQRRLRILYELIAALLQPDLDDLLERLLERVVQLLGAERGYIFLRGEDGTIELRVTRGGDGEHARPLVERVLSSGLPRYLVDGSEGSDTAPDPQLSIICVPFVHGDDTTGALYLDSSTPFGSRFSLEEGHLLASLAGLAATAIENARAEMSRRRLEEQLQQAQKMETVGTLAGGIAHDFNNLLSAMIGTLSVLDWQIDADPNRSESDLRDQLAILRDCALRAAEIVQQLLSLSRRGELKVSAVDLGGLIGDVVKLCRASFDPRIEMEIQSSGEPAWVEAEPVRIKQALLNLAVNARDAMPDGGRITFDVRPVQRKDGRRFVRLVVRDTGKGIEAEHLPRVFDPFFTTKPVGKGTGLGLAMVYNIVSQHHGTVRVESHPDKGSAFSIDLPASSPTAYSAGIPPSELPHGTESILLVDDEQVVRQLARGMLQMLGYRVLVAADGEEAIRLLTSSREKVDLVILDLIMPRMSGRDALLALRALRPALPILVSTGVQLDALALGTRGIPISGVLNKPYDFTDLAIAVRLALDNTPTPRIMGGTAS